MPGIMKIKGIPVELGGDTYIVPPIALGALEQLQDRLATFTGDPSDKEQIAVVIDAAYAALRRNYPDMTRDQVADILDVGSMIDVFQALMDVSGVKRKAMEAAATPGESQPGV